MSFSKLVVLVSKLYMCRQVDYTKGIFQSIGFKEFSPYFLLPEEEKNSDKGEKVLEQCVEVLKLVTRRYARKQTKWTVNRFLARKDRQVGISPPTSQLTQQ